MFQTLKKAWGVPEIRKKLLYTLLMIILFRFGSAVTVPFLNPDVVKSWMSSNATGGNFLEYLNTLTGGALSQATVSPRSNVSRTRAKRVERRSIRSQR